MYLIQETAIGGKEMKAYEIINVLGKYGTRKDYSKSCDTIKAGSPETEVNKVVVTMFPTVELVRRAKEWGAQMIIVHEPTYYKHMDEHSDDKIECEKRVFIESTGIVIYRFHDHPHVNKPDMIAAGGIRQLDLPCDAEYPEGRFGLARLTLQNPITPIELAKRIEEKFGIKHLRIAGNREKEITHISTLFGTPGGVLEELQEENSEVILTGEIMEWALGEYVRDAAALGYRKTLLVMGHEGSEWAGMLYTADLLKEACPELEVVYMDCGEVYTYTDSK